MALLRAGATAAGRSSTALIAPDPGRDQRQLHVIDAPGQRRAAHRRRLRRPGPASVHGADVSVAGNMLAGPGVLDAMLDGFARRAAPCRSA